MFHDIKVSKKVTITKKETLLIVVSSIAGALGSQMYNDLYQANNVFNSPNLSVLLTIVEMVVFMWMMVMLIFSATYWIIKITDRKKRKKKR